MKLDPKNKKTYHYDLSDQFFFWISVIWYNFAAFLECKKGKKQLLIAECLWFLMNVFKIRPKMPPSIASDYIETSWGKFYIAPNLFGTMIASPAFERVDLNYLLSLIRKDIQYKKRILFIDVGAYYGDYTVKVGNNFKRYKNFYTVAFEPDTEDFESHSYALLKKNIKINHLQRVKTYKLGLGSGREKKKNRFGLTTYPLDTVLGKEYSKKFDSIFIKIDIEGYEVDALEGAKGFFKNAKEVTFLVEDYLGGNIVNYMKKKTSFITKRSPYNSFWYLKNE